MGRLANLETFGLQGTWRGATSLGRVLPVFRGYILYRAAYSPTAKRYLLCVTLILVVRLRDPVPKGFLSFRAVFFFSPFRI